MLKNKHIHRIFIAVEFMFTEKMESNTQSGFQLFPVTCFVSTSGETDMITQTDLPCPS